VTSQVRSRDAIHEALGPDGQRQLVVVDDGRRGPVSFTLVAGDGGTWVLRGEVDFACAPALASALRRTRGTPWVVDVAGLEFVDVAGMRAIAAAAAGAGTPLELHHASPRLRRLWAIAGFARAAAQVLLVP